MTKVKPKAKLLTVREVAERLDVAPSTVRIWRIAGRFPNCQAEETPRGRIWYIPDSDLHGFQKRRPGRPPSAKKGGKRNTKRLKPHG